MLEPQKQWTINKIYIDSKIEEEYLKQQLNLIYGY